MAPPPPRSCDTFVFVAGGAAGPAATLFGKNSDRPSEEEHEVVYLPAARHTAGSAVKCTYISIPQVAETLAVVLSRPRWLWGCEMGANERGVVGGNEAIWTSLAGELGSEARLLGMDILRLALERGPTARDAARVCAELTEAHGQGGGCAEGDSDWTYENGYLFADAAEAFVVETCGPRGWVMERVEPGSFRNISNGASIREDVFEMKAGLREDLARRGLCAPEGALDWKAAVAGAGGCRALELSGRERAGRDALAAMARDLREGRARPEDLPGLARRMMGVLRDEDSGICFRDLHGFCSTGSQVSWLPPGAAAQHFFTCASDPLAACYKRFCFPAAPAAPTDHRSLELWRARRRLALAGGPPPAPAAAAALEEAALRAAAEGAPGGPSELHDACGRELDALAAGE